MYIMFCLMEQSQDSGIYSVGIFMETCTMWNSKTKQFEPSDLSWQKWIGMKGPQKYYRRFNQIFESGTNKLKFNARNIAIAAQLCHGWNQTS